MKNCDGSKASGVSEISYSLPCMTFAQPNINKIDNIRAFNHTNIILNT